MSDQICAVIVTFFPDLSHLCKVLQRLREQVAQVVVVDNSEQHFPGGALLSFGSFVIVLHNNENIGVAAAQNQGILWAKKHLFTHVLLLDQDSLPESRMVQELIRAEKNKLSQGIQVAAVGPNILDSLTNTTEPLIKIQKFWVRKTYCGESTACRDVDYIISSGCLIRLAVLSTIGLMDESLFIDLVDIEWGLRSRHKGFCLYVVCAARLLHSIGTKEKIFYCQDITRHQPQRLYYQFRNYLLVASRSKGIPCGWFVYHVIRHLLPRLILFCFFVKPRMRNSKMIAKGLYDGLMGVSGKYKL